MIGIYRIFNFVTGQSYIGQSKNIMDRIEEHFYHRTSQAASNLDKDIAYYGINNFGFQILTICDPVYLDYLEDYYIKLYQSNIFGYNIIAGGQNNDGESNPNCKITVQDVYWIREMYNNHQDPNTIYDLYFKGKISINSFFAIWEGKSWKSVHMDVYTNENLEFYKNLINDKDSKNKSVHFSDEEVFEFRSRFVNETAEQIYYSTNINCKFNTFRSMLSGSSYKHVPIYNKRTKSWVYN